MNVTYIYADMPQEMNCSQHNCIRPAKALNDGGKHQAKLIHVNQFASNSPEVRQFCEWADILVVERNFFGDVHAALEFWRIRNKPMIAIFDDAYHIITEDNPAYNFWHNNLMSSSADTVATRINQLFNMSKDQDNLWANIPPEKRNKTIDGITKILNDNIPQEKQMSQLAVPAMVQFQYGLKKMRGIQVPSRMLAEDWSKTNDTYYIHNYINPNQYIHAKRLLPKNNDEIVIGWHGSLSHVASFNQSGVKEALEIVAKKYNNVKIYLGGDKRNFDAVDLPKDKKRFHTYVPEQDWPGLMKSMDIAVAPLATEYDKRRSWIRGIEYMALQVPWIATNFPTYEELSDYGYLVDNGVDNWVNALTEMIDHIDDYREKAKGDPYEFALSQSYDLNMDKTIKVYEENINKGYKW